MSFDSLPNDVILQIVQNLPLKQQCRLGRVSKRFNEISQMAICKLKNFELNEDMYEFIYANGVSTLLDLCSPNLERIILKNKDSWSSPVLYKILPNYTYPQLTELIDDQPLMDDDDYYPIPIAHCPNLRKLRIHESNFMTDDYVASKLEFLDFTGALSDDDLCSLIGKVPNLKELRLGSYLSADRETLELLFASVPHLETLEMSNGSSWALFESESFWRLNLKLFEIQGPMVDSRILTKISASFPLLEKLWLPVTDDVNGYDVGALGCLTNLRDLHIDGFGRTDAQSDGVQNFIGLQNLTSLDICFTLSPDDFINFIRFCPKLSDLTIHYISEITTPEMAVVVLESLRDIGKRKVTVQIIDDDCPSVWKEAIDEVAIFLKSAGGPEIVLVGVLW